MQLSTQLADMYLFKGVPARDLRALVDVCRPLVGHQNEVLLRQGEPADHALLIVTGRYVAVVDTDHGQEVVGESRSGEIIGETALFLRGATRSATVSVLEPGVVLSIGPQVFERAPDNAAVIALEKHMLGTLARRIRGANTHVQKAWKESSGATPPEPTTPGLLARLRALFGGAH